MADLAVQPITRQGVAPAFAAAAAGGDTVPGGADRFVVVKNGSAGPVTVTIDSVRPCDQGFDHNEAVVVPAAGERWIGPLLERFQTATGRVALSYSAVATVTVASLELA